MIVSEKTKGFKCHCMRDIKCWKMAISNVFQFGSRAIVCATNRLNATAHGKTKKMPMKTKWHLKKCKSKANECEKDDNLHCLKWKNKIFLLISFKQRKQSETNCICNIKFSEGIKVEFCPPIFTQNHLHAENFTIDRRLIRVHAETQEFDSDSYK